LDLYLYNNTINARQAGYQNKFLSISNTCLPSTTLLSSNLEDLIGQQTTPHAACLEIRKKQMQLR